MDSAIEIINNFKSTLITKLGARNATSDWTEKCEETILTMAEENLVLHSTEYRSQIIGRLKITCTSSGKKCVKGFSAKSIERLFMSDNPTFGHPDKINVLGYFLYNEDWNNKKKSIQDAFSILKSKKNKRTILHFDLYEYSTPQKRIRHLIDNNTSGSISNFKDALTLIESTWQNQPDPILMLQKLEIYERSGQNPGEGLKFYNQVKQIVPMRESEPHTNSRLHYLLGRLHSQHGHIGDGLNYYSLNDVDDPKNPFDLRSIFEIASFYFRIEDFIKAKRKFEVFLASLANPFGFEVQKIDALHYLALLNMIRSVHASKYAILSYFPEDDIEKSNEYLIKSKKELSELPPYLVKNHKSDLLLWQNCLEAWLMEVSGDRTSAWEKFKLILENFEDISDFNSTQAHVLSYKSKYLNRTNDYDTSAKIGQKLLDYYSHPERRRYMTEGKIHSDMAAAYEFKGLTELVNYHYRECARLFHECRVIYEWPIMKRIHLILDKLKINMNYSSYNESRKKIGYSHHKEFVDFVIKDAELKLDSFVLDIGCGSGIDLNEIRQQTNCQVIGIDADSNVLHDAMTKIPVICANIETTKIPVQDSSVDAIIVVNVTHLLKNRIALAAEVYRLLKQNGKFYLPLMTEEYLSSLHIARYFPTWAQKEYERQWKFDDAEKILTTTGFKIVNRVNVSMGRIKIDSKYCDDLEKGIQSGLSLISATERLSGLTELKKDISIIEKNGEPKTEDRIRPVLICTK
ncbi:MAG: class I SAM-dependent methyltransferase [Flavobacteriales bacterium]|nr:class I SAM-dependent methyltransferase [Flavobacteriales bacterium]